MTSSPAEAPLFDPSAIEKLRAVAGDEADSFVKEMVQLFLEETLKSVAEIRRAADAKEWRVVMRAAHSLKSSAATLGLMRFSAACKALELDTKDGAETPLTLPLTRSVFDQFEATKGTLQSLA